MADQVDRETVEDIISTLNSIQFFDQVHDVDLSAAAKALRALLTERDRLREALKEIAGTEWNTDEPADNWCPEHARDYVEEMETFCNWAIETARATLKGDQA